MIANDCDEIFLAIYVRRKMCELFHPGAGEPTEHEMRSVLHGVRTVLDRGLSFITPESLHTAWVRYHVDRGWKYGPEKDSAQKTHPCLVPYYQLSLKDRLKDFAFIEAVKDALAESALATNERARWSKVVGGQE